MKIPALDQTESLLIIGAVAVVAYLAYKAKQATDDAVAAASRAYNALGQRADATIAGVPDAMGGLYDPAGIGRWTTSQIMEFFNSRGQRAPSEEYALYDEGGAWVGTPDIWIDGAKRMAKPSYGRLSQPNTPYVQ